MTAVAALWVLWPSASDEDRRVRQPDAATTDGIAAGDHPEPFRYVREVTVAAGERVEITNPDNEPHTFTSDDGFFDSGTVEPGGSAVVAGLDAGRYGFHCEIHPALTGELVIGG